MAAFAATLIRGPTELREMRHLLISWLGRTDATAAVRDAVLLATHEAAANAMKHGQQEGPVSISASQDEAGGFAVEVTNLGGWKEPDPGHHGRGLALMSELMSEVEIQTKTSVRMLSGAPPAEPTQCTETRLETPAPKRMAVLKIFEKAAKAVSDRGTDSPTSEK
jgi:anti-sigma regulatory factor (Ser/Thr protein kinase)